MADGHVLLHFQNVKISHEQKLVTENLRYENFFLLFFIATQKQILTDVNRKVAFNNK